MLRTILVLCGLIAGAVYFQFGTLSPCSMLREQARQHDGLVAALSDSMVDILLAAQFGSLNPARCASLLVNANKHKIAVSVPQRAPASVPILPPGTIGQKEAQDAMTGCRKRRLKGELKSYVESANCSNPSIIAAYKHGNYPYMDLIETFTAKRLEVAQRIDQGLMNEAQAQQELERTQQALAGIERNRASSH